MENVYYNQSSQQPCLGEREICYGYEHYIEIATATAKAKGLVAHNGGHSEGVSASIVGSSLCLYYAALRSSASIPSVQLPQFAGTAVAKQLQFSSCPPKFLGFFNRWAQMVPKVQALSQSEQNELERIICNQPSFSAPTSSSYAPRCDVTRVHDIANHLYSIASDISQSPPEPSRYIRANITPVIIAPKWPEPKVPKALLDPYETPFPGIHGPPSPLSGSPLSPHPSPRLSPRYDSAPNSFEQIGAPALSTPFLVPGPKKTEGPLTNFSGSRHGSSSFIGGFSHPSGFTSPPASPGLQMPFPSAVPFGMPEPRISRALSEGKATVYTYSSTHVDINDTAGAADQIAAVISSSMSISDIVTSLASHGCRNLSQQLDASSFSPRPVSRGGFSEIYFGRLYDGMPVAIKTIFIHSNDHDQERKYLKRTARELYTWSKCNHVNVASLLGLAAFREQIVMVSAWMENGDLRTYVNKNPAADRLNLCTQVADGLAYLHSIGIIHGDLKGPNVLISKEGVATVIDFGNAVLEDSTLQFTEEATSQKISIRWTAPEILRGGKHSAEADMYALGMTILETFTGKAPHFEKNDRAVIQAITRHENPERPQESIPTSSVWGDSLWDLLVQCWDNVPERRPTAIKARDLMEFLAEERLK
ncbi:hypothetical protein FRC12_001753 [Ceratobasidium sp. 428]|nr:hypothetical protein FRC12_001753 [Ceratobasidium sp. 428]